MGKKKILIVEDDSHVRLGLNVRLMANDYETLVAPDAVMATSLALKQRPDLILLDLGLPGGDGFLVMERLKSLAALACVPIIVVSGKDPMVNKPRALQAGAVAYFQKPAENDELLSAIRKALGEPVW